MDGCFSLLKKWMGEQLGADSIHRTMVPRGWFHCGTVLGKPAAVRAIPRIIKPEKCLQMVTDMDKRKQSHHQSSKTAAAFCSIPPTPAGCTENSDQTRFSLAPCGAGVRECANLLEARAKNRLLSRKRISTNEKSIAQQKSKTTIVGDCTLNFPLPKIVASIKK